VITRLNRSERNALRGILIAAGLLLAVTSMAFVILAAGLDGLSGMGNPGEEVQREQKGAEQFRTIVLLFVILAGGGMILLGLWIRPLRTMVGSHSQQDATADDSR
jgi:hypothetical protein